MKRPFCIIGASFMLTAFFASFCDIKIQAVCLTACILMFFIGIFYLKESFRTLVCVATCSAAVAFSLFLFVTILEQPILQLDGQEMVITANILSVTQRDGGKYSYQVEVLPKDDKIPTAFKTILYTNHSLHAEIADQIVLPVEFYRPQSTDYFDGERYYRADRIRILSYYNGSEDAKIIPAKQNSLLTSMQDLNQMLSKKADEKFSANIAPIFKSMLLGNRTDISFAMEQKYSNAGIIHLLVVSGIHVSVLTGFLFGLLTLFKIRRRIVVLLCIGVTAFFVLLSGAGLSAIRAGCMVILMLIGRLFYRKVESVNSLCCAGFLIVLCDIYAIMDIGFQMSFLSTLGILLCATPLKHYICRKLQIVSRFLEILIGSLTVTLTANLFLLPIYFTTFGTISMVSPFANVITAITSFLIIILGMPLLTLWICCAPNWLADIFCRAQEIFITFQNAVAEWLGSIPFATIGLDYDLILLWFILSLFVVIVVLLLKNRGELYRPAAVFCAALFVLCNAYNLFSYRDVLRIAVVGDGTTSNVIFIDQFHATVISPSDDNYIDEATYRYLKKKGIHQIDTMFLMYPNFQKYQDTLDLLSVFKTETVLYHRDNIAAKQIINPQSKQQLPMKSLTKWQMNIGVEGEFRYDFNGMNAEIKYLGNRILLSNIYDERVTSGADLCLIRGQARDITKVKSDQIVLLERQWDVVTTNHSYDTAQEKVLEFEIGKDGVLRQIT